MPERVENSLVGGFIMTRHNDRAAPVQVEPGRADELSKTDPEEMDRRLAEGTTGPGKRGWPKGRKRRTKLAVLGIPADALDAGSPQYARCVRLASAYRKARCRELVICHGYVSSGASALLASAAMAMAASRLLYEQAAQGGEKMHEQLKTAAKLADSARQNELAAWELCAREAVASKKAKIAATGMPWVVTDDEGNQKPRPGPKSKQSREDAILLMQLPPAEVVLK